MRIDRDTARGIGGVLLALAIIAGIHQLRAGSATAPDFSCGKGSSGSVSVDVHSGETGSSIGRDLAKLGVVKSSAAFYRVAVTDKRAASIAPGIHKIDKGLCAQEALNQLLDSRRISNLLSVVEGAWNSEIKRSLSSIGYSQSEIAAGFARVTPPPGFTSLEGLLFPAQYSFESATAVNEILATMVARALNEMKRAGFDSRQEKFSSAQLLTIASLVQAEGDEVDYPKISQVIRNRLKKGMPLQFDSTVHYIKGVRGSVFLSTKSTFLKSPYNTYRNYGLPPSPINNPGSKALQAAINPESGNWLYFITVAPGDTRFTDSLDQFNSWKAIYKKNLRAGLFRSQK